MKPCFHLLLFVTVAFAQALGEPPPVIRKKENLSVRNEVQIAIDKGLGFLKAQQQPNGSWEKENNYPALTAYPLFALQNDPKRRYQDHPEFMKKGYEILRKSALPSGRICKEEFALANTAICMMTLFGTGDPKDEPLIQSARAYLGASQIRNGAVLEMEGGFTYGDEGDRQASDLHNTLLALEAIRYHTGKRPDAKFGEQNPDWRAALEFVTHCQNLRSYNKSTWASDDPANKGGFIYMPGYSSAGDVEVTPGARRVLRSYGSMSSAGLLCLLYCDAPKDDPRVVAATRWLQLNFSLDENPGMKRSGLFLHYHLLAKAVALTEMDEFQLPDGRTVDAPHLLATKFLELQKSDGSWINDNGRWMENEPVLTTSYIVIALEVLHDRL